ncbi:hypothetical protein BYT27DRAFT_7213576 [Phlegmacium glaucopus]|nr:hypothetical protein BYT27DRAFT_7213576 [Phlegmacium glaucopus]
MTVRSGSGSWYYLWVLWVQVENTTFGLDVRGLLQHSEPLRQILQLQPSEESKGTDNNLIVVNGVTVGHFESFMIWVNHLAWKPPKDLSKEVLVDILHMCTMWYIHDGINFSQYGLKQLEIPATERIKLAQQYKIYDWVAPAIQELLKLPLNSLFNDDLNHINLRVYSIIARAKEAMERQRKIIAAFPPSLPKDSHDFQTAWCPSHATCAKV